MTLPSVDDKPADAASRETHTATVSAGADALADTFVIKPTAISSNVIFMSILYFVLVSTVHYAS